MWHKQRKTNDTQRNVEKKQQHFNTQKMTMDKFDDILMFFFYVLVYVFIYIFWFEMNLNRALHCNQMIIHIKSEKKRERTHTYIEGEIDDHENGGIKEIADMHE